MNLEVGTGKRLTAGALERAAREIGCDVPAIQAVLEVECRGRGFDEHNRVVILFEPHVFYRNLEGRERDLAVKKGLARASWKKDYPKGLDGVYKQLYAAMQINEEAALKSASWGLSQILGENYGEAGCDDVFEFVEKNLKGEDAQLDLMVEVIKHRRLDDELRDLRWAAFARSWNGKSYAANQYDTKLAAAYRKYSGKRTAKISEFPEMGETGGRVQHLQELLCRAGFRLKVDSDFGPETKRQIRLFQLDQGLEGTGQLDKKTWDALVSAPEKRVPEPRAEKTVKELVAEGDPVATAGDALVKAGKVGGTAIAVGGTAHETGALDKAAEVADKITDIKPAVDAVSGWGSVIVDNLWILAVLAAGGVAYLGYRLLKAHLQNVRRGDTL